MSGPSAQIIADSIGPHGIRLTTMEVRIHRFVLSELNTHRVFSRNSASSRARSVKKTIVEVGNDIALPLEFRTEKIGMSGGDLLTGKELLDAQMAWLRAGIDAVLHAKKLASLGVHKSIVNRVLEPFMWHTVVITSVEWENFFRQRAHPDAQPELRVAAELMMAEYQKSQPTPLNYGDWHLPYISEVDRQLTRDDIDGLERLIKVSVARCAGVSYLRQHETRDHERDVALYDRLLGSTPPHASPLEHVAVCTSEAVYGSNLTGWRSRRIEVGL